MPLQHSWAKQRLPGGREGGKAEGEERKCKQTGGWEEEKEIEKGKKAIETAREKKVEKE